jgi:cell division septation protein DedD
MKYLICWLLLASSLSLADNVVDALLAKAKAGDPAAQFDIATLYLNGDGVPENKKMAVNWFTKAAEQGDRDAQYNLGEMYVNGVGVNPDMKEAVSWYTRAAKQGDKTAQGRLANIYYAGEGVTADEKQAYIWIYLAAAGEPPDSIPAKNRNMLADKLGKEAAETLEKQAHALVQKAPSSLADKAAPDAPKPVAAKPEPVAPPASPPAKIDNPILARTVSSSQPTPPPQPITLSQPPAAKKTGEKTPVAIPLPTAATTPTSTSGQSPAQSVVTTASPSANKPETVPAKVVTIDTGTNKTAGSEPPDVVNVTPPSANPEPAATADTKPVASRNGRYAVQVASLSTQLSATALITKLKAKGFNAFSLTQKTAKGDNTYRVLVGPHSDSSSAATAKKSIDKEMGLKTLVVPFGTR